MAARIRCIACVYTQVVPTDKGSTLPRLSRRDDSTRHISRTRGSFRGTMPEIITPISYCSPDLDVYIASK